MTIGRVHQPLRSLVSDELRRLVVTGELPPGSRIVEDRLAERLGVSREVLARARDATDLGELDLLSTYNTEFHSVVVELSGNDYLRL